MFLVNGPDSRFLLQNITGERGYYGRSLTIIIMVKFSNFLTHEIFQEYHPIRAFSFRRF